MISTASPTPRGRPPVTILTPETRTMNRIRDLGALLAILGIMGTAWTYLDHRARMEVIARAHLMPRSERIRTWRGHEIPDWLPVERWGGAIPVETTVREAAP